MRIFKHGPHQHHQTTEVKDNEFPKGFLASILNHSIRKTQAILWGFWKENEVGVYLVRDGIPV